MSSRAAFRVVMSERIPPANANSANILPIVRMIFTHFDNIKFWEIKKASYTISVRGIQNVEVGHLHK